MNKKASASIFIIILLISILVMTRTNLTLRQANEQLTPTVVTRPVISIDDLVKTSGDCRLPCFWGIEPGVTKWAEAINLFNQLGIKGVTGTSPREIKYFTANVEASNVTILLNLYQKDDFVGAILLTITNKSSLIGIHTDIEQYSIHKRFQDLGMPTDILLKFDFAPEGPSDISSYSFWVIYENYGVQEDYIGSFRQIDDSKICPEQTVEQVMLYLYSPTLDFLPWGPNISGDAEKLENLSSTSAIDFFQSSVQSNALGCIEIKQ